MFKITYFVGLPEFYGSQYELKALVLEHFPDGATIVFGFGVWKDELEPQGTVTEVKKGDAIKEGFINACKASLGQDKVLVLVERLERAVEL